LSIIRDEFKNKKGNIKISSSCADLVGYETLIEFIKLNDILSIKGDLVEIGAFLGGGTYKLSKFLEGKRSSKKLYVIDIFDLTFDRTVNNDGNEMATLYLNGLKAYGGKTQWNVFLEITKGCKNVFVLKGDSKYVTIPSNNLCFGFIDGNHKPEYVENDFYLVWNKLLSKGVVAFHDYEWDLPQTTIKIKELVSRHFFEIQGTYFDKNKHILFIVKK